MFELFIVLRFAQLEVSLAHVKPGISIELEALREYPCILKMAVTLVISSQCQPGAIRLDNAGRYGIAQQDDVFGTTDDGLARIEPILHFHTVGGVFGKHHQSPDAGG